MEISNAGCEIQRTFCPLTAHAYERSFLVDSSWRSFCVIHEEARYWLNQKLLRIVGYVEGDVITYQAKETGDFWTEAALIKIFSEEQLGEDHV